MSGRMGAMTTLHVRHVATALHQRFDGLIDLADVANAGENQREQAFLTRALAAQALQRVSGASDHVAAAAVTDGTGDNGVDAVYVDLSDTVVLVPSKWSSAGTGSIGLGEARNFIAGLKDLTDERYDRFNAKFQAHVSALQAALLNPEVNFVMVVATTGMARSPIPSPPPSLTWKPNSTMGQLRWCAWSLSASQTSTAPSHPRYQASQ